MILDKDPPVDPQAGAELLKQLRRHIEDPHGLEILERFQRDPGGEAGNLAEYLSERLKPGEELAESLAQEPQLPAQLRAEIYGGRVERLIQIAEVGTLELAPPRVKRSRRFYAAMAAMAVVLLVAALVVAARLTRPKPMGEGFNVAVAPFTEVDQSGREQVTELSRDFSQVLLDSIQREIDLLPVTLQTDLRGPDQLKPVTGQDRAEEAAKLAKEHNAKLLIYGRVTHNESGSSVVPEFYISDQAFNYGSEVAGADRLGSAISLGDQPDLELDASANKELYVRVRVLRYLVSGLAYMYTSNYREAELNLETAATDPDWGTEAGKEVGYLLWGAARLLQFDSQTNPNALPGAEQAFEKARKIKPNYPRPYIGLGEVALLGATRDQPNQAERLQEAAQMFSQARVLAGDDQVTAAKADYGLGRAHLVGFENGFPGWSQDEAKKDFERVLSAYDDGNQTLLAWNAAHANAYLGRLAGWEGDWTQMYTLCRQAILMLRDLPGQAPALWAARYWEYAGDAEIKRGDPGSASSAYRQAIALGSENGAESQELERWQNKLNQLETGTP
jgi:tetratricopeptide (TPR) repeat protein